MNRSGTNSAVATPDLPRSSRQVSKRSTGPVSRNDPAGLGAVLEDRVGRGYVAPVELALARQFVEAVVAHDFETADELLDPDVEVVTPRGSLRGIDITPRFVNASIIAIER